jgi:ribose 5-phosphate isomerase B
VIDEGAEHGNSGTHYPEYAMKVASAVQKDPENTLGILVCGTGIGMSMVANKFDGVRAALCGDTFSARMTRSSPSTTLVAANRSGMSAAAAWSSTRCITA